MNCSLDGTALARAMEPLEELALMQSVRPLTGFTSIEPAVAAAFLADEGVAPGEIKLPPVQHFAAEEGLTTLEALIAHLEKQPSAIRNSARVLADLRDCRRILTAAQQNGVRWRFQVDF